MNKRKNKSAKGGLSFTSFFPSSGEEKKGKIEVEARPVIEEETKVSEEMGAKNDQNELNTNTDQVALNDTVISDKRLIDERSETKPCPDMAGNGKFRIEARIRGRSPKKKSSKYNIHPNSLKNLPKVNEPLSEEELDEQFGFVRSDPDFETAMKNAQLRPIVNVQFVTEKGRLTSKEISRAILRKFGFKSLEEKTQEQFDAIKAGTWKKPRIDPVFRKSIQDAKFKADLIKHCATNLSDFIAIFLGEGHISKPFGSFHLELLRDLYHLSISTRDDNYAISLTNTRSTSDNNHYVKYSKDNANTPIDTRTYDGVPPVSALSISEESELDQADRKESAFMGELDSQERGGGDAREASHNSLQTPPNFTEQNETSKSDVKSPEGSESTLFDTTPPHPRNMDRYDTFDRLAIAAPRGHAKTTLVSLGYVIWAIVYKVHNYILLISDSEDQAKMLLGSVRAELENNEKLRGSFGDLVGDRVWGEMAIETSSGIRIQSRGTGQKIRGLKYKQYRPDLVICDDIQSDQSTENEEQRTKTKRWFYSALMPALADNGKILTIGTILHEDDLLTGLLDQWPSRLYSADKNNDPRCLNPLWPAKFRPQDLIRVREGYEADGMVDLFYREYFNQIVSPDAALFKKKNFKYFKVSDLTERIDKGEKFKCFLTVDPAYTVQSQRDYTVFCVTHVDSGNNIYVTEIVRGRYTVPQLLAVWFNLLEKYHFSGIGIQKIDWDKSLKTPLMTEMTRRQVFFRVTPLQVYSSKNKGLANKETRIAQLAPRYEVGSIHHLEDGKGIKDLEDELLHFPHSKYDDCGDALAMQLNLIFPAEKKKEKKRFFEFDQITDEVSGY